MIAIEYKDIVKKYHGNENLSVSHLSATIQEGEFITILGSSGCGKTTLLKMTNRLIAPTSGSIELFGQDISQIDEVKMRRSMGYVIQQVGLFPHMTVEENISLIPKLEKWEKKHINRRVDELLKLVDLDPQVYKLRYPSSLSGGQLQRVGLARALVCDPKVMLLDEPFGAIDAITRLNLQNELKKIHEGTKKTFLLVTHDINEAFTLGNRVMIINDGQLVQFDKPINIIKHPVNNFVKSLLSIMHTQINLWENFHD